MNNDISDVNNIVRASRQAKLSNNSAEVCHTCTPNVSNEEQNENKKASMKNSMDYLGTMGYAQVNMSNPLTKGVKASVDSFLDDPEYVQQHVDMCDDFVEDGMSLIDAIYVTDQILDTLKTEETYM